MWSATWAAIGPCAGWAAVLVPVVVSACSRVPTPAPTSDATAAAPAGDAVLFDAPEDAAPVKTALADPGPALPTPCSPGALRCVPGQPFQSERCVGGTWSAGPICDAAAGKRCVDEQGCQSECASALHCTWWAVDLDNAYVPGSKQQAFDAAGADFAVTLVNRSALMTAQVAIDTNEGPVLLGPDLLPLDLSPIPPGGLRVLRLPRRDLDGTTIKPVPYRITSNVPLAVAQYNPIETIKTYCADASWVLADAHLGQDHLVVTREQSFTILRGFVAVVATRPGTTTVKLQLPASVATTLPSSDGKIPGYEGGAALTFTLQQWDALNLESNSVGADFTGTRVQTSQPAAVFGGSEAANAPNTNHCSVAPCAPGELEKGLKCGRCTFDTKTTCRTNEHCSAFITCCADHLEIQIPPVAQWGWNHVAVKFFPKGNEPDLWRIVAATDDTSVELNPPPKDLAGLPLAVPKLQAGQWHELETTANFLLTARHADGSPAPVLVAHFMTSQDAPAPNVNGAQPGDAGMGDPALSLAVPVEQWPDVVHVGIVATYAFNYLTLIVAGDAGATLDGAAVTPDLWHTVTTKYKFTRMLVAPGSHVVRGIGPDGKPAGVSVEVHGFDQYLSYAFPAATQGLDLGYEAK